MEKKPYKLGILLGRFQTLHIGHETMINKAAELCETVGIFVGSSNESGTNKNPFSYETREKMLKAVFGDSIVVYPLPDIGVGNTAKWGEYVIKNVVERFGQKPDLLISGKETRRTSWFDSDDSAAELYVPKTVDVSASEMREFFLKDDFESWKQFTNPKLWGMYEELKAQTIASKDNLESGSI